MFWGALGDYRGPLLVRSFIRYTIERSRRDGIARSFRVYMTDAVWLMGSGKYPGTRWLDTVDPPDEIDVNAIVDDVITRAGLEVI